MIQWTNTPRLEDWKTLRVVRWVLTFKNGSIDSINSKMKLINEEFSKQASEYPQSFSFGIVYINGNKETSLLNILQTADQRMYAQKRKK